MTEHNPSGIVPLDLRVLVKPDPVEVKTSGGIILPDQVVESKKWETCKATLVAVGTCAWSEARASRGFEAPQPGTRVLVGKYSGVLVKGDDGEDYRLMNDEDVTAILKEG